jgi:hypothetical protein
VTEMLRITHLIHAAERRVAGIVPDVSGLREKRGLVEAEILRRMAEGRS